MRTTVTGQKQDLSRASAVDSLMEYLRRHIEWSEETFGPNPRRKGVLDHIRKEIKEVEKESDPDVAFLEWIDIIILGIDGAQRELLSRPPDSRASFILQALFNKQNINKLRKWPDWRKGSPDKAIEHDRSSD